MRNISEATASLVFAGDVSFAPPIRKGNSSACNYTEVLRHVAKCFDDSNYNMVNLESPFVERGLTKVPGKGSVA